MAALSDYLESGLLQHMFMATSFPKPSNISIALTSGVAVDSDTGATIPEMAGGGYSRVTLGDPADEGDSKWVLTEASGFISNSGQIIFNTALVDWGWVSGIAVCDSAAVGSGNLLMHSALTNPRQIYAGDNVKFEVSSLEISFK